MAELTLQQLLSAAAEHVRANRFDDARIAFQSILDRHPQEHVAIYGLGWIALQTGDAAAAVQMLLQAIKIAPFAVNHHNALGMSHAALGDLPRAIEAYRKAVSIQPRFADAWHNLANGLRDQGEHIAAIDAYKHALQNHPTASATHRTLGTLLASVGKLDDAVIHLSAAVRCDPSDSRAWCNLGLALEDLGRRDEAIAALRSAQELDPASPMIAYHLAALGGAASPAICPPDYVVELFDGYADCFDEHLVRRLNYRGPELLLEAIEKVRLDRKLDILDLGCGTGLCGALFRPLAASLVGVDLSSRMVERSRVRGVYDRLIKAEIVDAIRSSRAQFDVILAADVFIYVGDLEAVFRAAADCLRSAGVFAFTIEFDPAADYAVRSTRRYTHSLDYIRRLAAANLFTELKANRVILRTNPDVDGYVIVLRLS